MSEMTEIAEPETSERSKVESWRLHVLIEAGYPLSLAERLAASEADLHQAIDNDTGLDIVVNIADPGGLTGDSVRRMLAETPGVAEVSAAQNVNAQIVAIDDHPGFAISKINPIFGQGAEFVSANACVYQDC